MSDAQLQALFKWLYHQTYSGVPGTDGDYIRMDEMKEYLPDAIAKIMREVK